MASNSGNPLFRSDAQRNLSGGHLNNSIQNWGTSSGWKSWDDRPPPFKAFENTINDDRYWWDQRDQQGVKVRISADPNCSVYAVATSLDVKQALTDHRIMVLHTRVCDNWALALHYKYVLEKMFSVDMPPAKFGPFIRGLMALYESLDIHPQGASEYIRVSQAENVQMVISQLDFSNDVFNLPPPKHAPAATATHAPSSHFMNFLDEIGSTRAAPVPQRSAMGAFRSGAGVGSIVDASSSGLSDADRARQLEELRRIDAALTSVAATNPVVSEVRRIDAALASVASTNPLPTVTTPRPFLPPPSDAVDGSSNPRERKMPRKGSVDEVVQSNE